MQGDKKQDLVEAAKIFSALRENTKSLMLATVGEDSVPNVSYAPFVTDETNNLFVYVSRLSARTSEMLSNNVVAVMLIEDEVGVNQIFARKRISYQCGIQVVDRNDLKYEQVLDRMSNRFGNIVSVLRSLSDFHLFRLSPISGRFVTGFGQAYELTGEHLDTLVHIGAGQISDA